jgi:Kdo2-lipid IVA lauroyltransferase/acyltransferase
MSELTFKARLVLGAVKLLGLLPLGLLRLLGHTMGSLLIVLPLREVTVSRKNIALCLPELDAQAQRKLLQQSLRELCTSLFELPKIWGAPYPQLHRLIHRIEGEELLLDAIRSDAGVLIAAPHLGAWELLNLYLASHAEIAVLYRAPKTAWMEAVLNRARARTRAVPVRAEPQAVRLLLRTLQNGGMVGILPDQQPKQGEGEFARMFGVDAFTMTLFPKLAARANVRTLFASCLRVRGGFEIVIRNADPEVLSTQALNQNVEQMAKLALAQYQWSYKRYSMRPNGQQNIYSTDAE